MRIALAASLLVALPIAGCAMLYPLGSRQTLRVHNSSSLVEFLYPHGAVPPPQDQVPQLRVPLRVGLGFLPGSSGGYGMGLTEADKEQLLEQVQSRFRSRKFVSDIVLVPDYYLASSRGFEGLGAVQRLYGLDLMALVSYDQVSHEDQNEWSLGYATIVGMYVFKGNRHDVSTLVDLAVVDPATHSLVLRAGGTDTRAGDATLINEERNLRQASAAGFAAANSQMIMHFDTALTQFETDVRSGRANVRVFSRALPAGGAAGGGGSLGLLECAVLLVAVGARARR
jgi:rhombotail lipoprotein